MSKPFEVKFLRTISESTAVVNKSIYAEGINSCLMLCWFASQCLLALLYTNFYIYGHECYTSVMLMNAI